MRMYLSSYLWGDKPEELFTMVDKSVRNAALITNAADQFPEVGIVERFEQDRQYLTSAGFTAERLDLRDYFDKDPSELVLFLKKFGLIWVRGANVFVLRRAMRQSGFDNILVKMLKNDEIVYGGYSAGACVVGSTLRGLDLVDDAYITPDGYKPEVIWEGLGLLPYAVAPHYKSNHPESPMIDKVVDFYEENKVPYKALRDGEAIIVNE